MGDDRLHERRDRLLTPGSTGNQLLQARALALMFAAGSVLSLGALLLPHDDVRAVPWAIDAALGLPVAVMLSIGWRRVPAWGFHAILLGGSVMVALGMTFAGGGSLTIGGGFFFVWVALYAFWFFSPPHAWAHAAMGSLLLGVGLAVSHTDGWPAVWLLATGTSAVVGAVTTLSRRDLSRLALRDHLTGLPNRQAVDELFSREVARASRSQSPLCLALLDVDRLKVVNDTRGHQAGDRLLQHGATRWRAVLRPTDHLVRLGGDEFLVLLPGCGMELATTVLQRIQTSGGPRCSIGLAQWQPGEDLSHLMSRADVRLYEAKRSRAGTVA